MLRRLSLALLALFAGAAGAACPDLPGAAALFEPGKPKIVWVGEMHGTAEMPALFADMVCIAGASGRKVVVLLERERGEQANWDAFLAGGDRTRLTAGKAWHWETQDGRSSEAMVALAERLRDYKVTIRLMQRGWDEPPAANHALDNETSMADSVRQAARDYPDALILAYSGGLHAKKSLSPFQKDLPLAASLLPAAEVTAVEIEGGSGTAWICVNDGCGVHSTVGETAKRGLTLGSPEAGYDAIAHTGLPSTASVPAIKLPGK